MSLGIWQATIVDDAGNILPGASVEVRLESSGAMAALKSDRGGTTGQDNPIIVGDDGFAQFFAVGGAYKITATSGAFEKVWRYVPIGTAAETDVPVGRTREHTAAGDVEVGPTDLCVIVNKAVGEATNANIELASARNGVDVIIKDGKGDADVYPITPVIEDGQLIDGIAASNYQITTPRGFLHISPLPDGTGYFQLASRL